MKDLWMYDCKNPDCATSYVPGTKKRPPKPPRCHSCGQVRHELHLYVPHPKALA